VSEPAPDTSGDGREQFDRAFAAGLALGLDDAVGLALGRVPT
jgi:hypothetical protein